MNKRRKYKWKLLVFVNCCCYFKQSFRICSAMHCDVLLLGYILNIHVWSEPPECNDILRYIFSCRASAIYGLPINLRYIWKRCSPLMCRDASISELMNHERDLHALFFVMHALILVLWGNKTTTHWRKAISMWPV